jgi:hypothetical protein
MSRSICHFLCRYIFSCKSWIHIAPRIATKYAKTFSVKSVEESQLSALRSEFLIEVSSCSSIIHPPFSLSFFNALRTE